MRGSRRGRARSCRAGPGASGIAGGTAIAAENGTIDRALDHLVADGAGPPPAAPPAVTHETPVCAAARSRPCGVPKTRSNPGSPACLSWEKIPPPTLSMLTSTGSGRGSTSGASRPLRS